jgi:hypothetical protein
MALIGRIVIMCAAVALGFLIAKGDVSCSVARGSLLDLKGAVSGTVQWTGQQGAGEASFTLPQPSWDSSSARATREPTPLGPR